VKALRDLAGDWGRVLRREESGYVLDSRGKAVEADGRGRVW
jgi:hypothetical protein